ncbi:MAG: hypothetical protein DRJ42_07095 [Deltaproteobacteria bacterium]|nr:MAG: hypothetical protein DRJ42_07095 [Deltaproteobacteria bacterium]
MARHHIFASVALVAAFLTISVSPAAAQGRGVDIERFSPALDAQGFLGIQATRTPGPGRWNFGLVMNYSIDPLKVKSPDVGIIDHRVGGNFLFQIGLGGRWALGVDVPLVVYQDTNSDPLMDGLGSIPSTALSDPRLILRYRFLGEDSTIDRERNEGEGVAMHGAITAPWGSDDSFASEEGVTTEFGFIADFHVFGAGIGGQAIWRHRTEPQTILGTRFEDELEFGVGLKIPIPVTSDFLSILEVRGIHDTADFTGPQMAIEGDIGLRLIRGDLAFTAVAGTGFSGGVGSPAFRGMLHIHWAPRVRDADNDHIPDDRDECPFLPEDFDGFEDSDGCLDPDNDNDLIPDPDDRCPNVAAEEGCDDDEDGCTDPGCVAGVVAAVDQCPDQEEDVDGFQDEDGCADPDNDGDGILDDADECPNEAEDMDGFEDENGCPDPDNDGDGILDEADQCPNDAEDMDGFEDEDGCPDPDNDHDGVLDADDQCADEQETINGVDDDDGCPDRGGRSLWRLQGERASEDVRVTGNVRFGRDGAIVAGSTNAVDQLARHIIALGGPVKVAIAADEEARRTSLTSALTERGVPADSVEVVTDSAARGNRVVVTRSPTSDDGAQGSTDAPRGADPAPAAE